MAGKLDGTAIVSGLGKSEPDKNCFINMCMNSDKNNNLINTKIR